MVQRILIIPLRAVPHHLPHALPEAPRPGIAAADKESGVDFTVQLVLLKSDITSAYRRLERFPRRFEELDIDVRENKNVIVVVINCLNDQLDLSKGCAIEGTGSVPMVRRSRRFAIAGRRADRSHPPSWEETTPSRALRARACKERTASCVRMAGRQFARAAATRQL